MQTSLGKPREVFLYLPLKNDILEKKRSIYMSSLFGCFNQGKMSLQNGLSFWNYFYGDNYDKKELTKDLFLGGYFSSLSSHPKNPNPLLSSDHCYGVIDAIIYNREEIISQTNATVSVSDEQLLFELIIQNGFAALKNVNGDFAGVIYNSDENTLYLFRDHLGIRPLFYYNDGFIFVFSTDIRGILSQKQLDISIDEEWSYKTISGFMSDSNSKTEYRNVFRVIPATTISVQLSASPLTISSNNYWKPATKKIRYFSQNKYKSELKKLVESSIKIRLDSFAGKIGVELSGGLDSSVIDVIINRLKRKCVCYSWSKSPEKLPIVESDDERIIINQICEAENQECLFNVFSTSEWLQIFDKNIKNLNLFDGSLIYNAIPHHVNTFPIYMTAYSVKEQGASVVFSGHGGDEGVSHRSQPYELFYHHEYYHYLRYHFAKTHGQKNRITKTLKRIKKDLHEGRLESHQPFRSSYSAEHFISEGLLLKSRDYQLSPLYFGFDPLKYILQGNSMDRPECAAFWGAYAKVQYVFPYLDYRVLDYALSIPRYCHLNKGRSRYIFKETFKDLIPEKLYKNTPKEDSSGRNRDNKQEEQDWFINFNKKRSRIISYFDRQLWSEILDFNKLDSWVSSNRPSDDKKEKNLYALRALESVLPAQTALTEARIALEHIKLK